MSYVAEGSSETSRVSRANQGGEARRLRLEELEERLAQRLSLIKHRVVVMSGKGGVGKSTVAVNLAVALSKSGKKVGVLDGDVHGPDVPKMFGLQGQSADAGPAGLLPVRGPQDVEIMSMAFLIPGEDTPVAWRGPLKHSLFQQFLADVDWGKLDYLIVDLPPGTGDEALSIAQLMGKPLWAIVVTTPQDVALLDSRKAVVFGKTLEANVLGIIENMSSLQCPYCGKHIDLFRVGGGEKAAHELGVPFLGRIPIDPNVVLGGDEGMP
ncbi:MAG: Mrp/NBP35 family ATP-binding protein, partial [Deltaproteobacteria bacterium]